MSCKVWRGTGARPGTGRGGVRRAYCELTDTLTCDNRVVPQNVSTRRLQDAGCADINDSGTVDVADLLMLLAAYGGSDTNADIAPNNVIDVQDLLALLAQYGTDCTRSGGGSGECECPRALAP
jgi:hypothetical protein